MRDFLDPVLMNQILNALLMFFISIFFYAKMGAALNLPMHLILGAGAFTVSLDCRDYSEEPNPRALLIGATILPIWPLARFWLKISENDELHF